MPDSGLNGKTAVVTGAAQGIGRATAKRLAQDGAHVVIVDIQDGSETVALIEEDGGSAEFREGDVTDEDSMAAALDGLEIDVFVNNAGYWTAFADEGLRQFHDYDVEDWDTAMDVNAKGTFVASKRAVPHFSQSGGSIVNISSNVVNSGFTGFMPYTASKSAIVGMTRVMAKELGDRNVRVNAIMPGLTRTEGALDAYDEEVFELIRSERAIGRSLDPVDVANAVAFLSKPESSMMTGQVLTVDGGESWW